MRRISVLLAFAAILLSAVVAYTYKLRVQKDSTRPLAPAPEIKNGYEALANMGWHYEKDDPQTNKPVVKVTAKSFEATHDPSTFELKDLALRLYNKDGSSYTYVNSGRALFNEGSGVLKSEGPVSIIMNVPSATDAENKDAVAKRVHVETSGVTYETKTGKARTDQPASFVFSAGDGQAVGAEYDPNTHTLHLKSQVRLDWIGNGPKENKLHVETTDLVYKELEQKIYLSPSATLRRQTTTIQGIKPVVVLSDGVLKQIDADHAFGTDDREGRRTDYSADHMTALFNEDGDLVNIVGDKHARVVATEPGSRTTITGDRADLRFTIDTKQQPSGQRLDNSDLHLVLADGHAIAESQPLPQPGVQLAETRILRSEHIILEMKPGGQEVKEIQSPSQAQLEFKPNRPDQSHRILDASHLRIVYGDSSYIDTFYAWNSATHTDKPATAPHVKATPAEDSAKKGPSPPALTWSDELVAKFTPNSNQVATIDQRGHFRYQEGVRTAQANDAFLEQTINRITLTGDARVSDDTGSTIAAKIVMNQANGDMDASGNVVSTHAPNPNQKPGTSMLDDTKSMEAKASQMQTREDNTKVFYQGHAVMWQGANRISADAIDVDRDNETLHALGNVVSELVDNKSNNGQNQPKSGSTPGDHGQESQPAPVFTIVRAPELFYRDDRRIALYTGPVKLTRDKMTVTAMQLEAFLTPKTKDNSDQSSLDHAFADGDVTVVEVRPDRTRTGTAQHCEYYTKESKVVLNGGVSQMVDSYKGITKGLQLTYYDDDDRLIVEGEKQQLAFTKMRKK